MQKLILRDFHRPGKFVTLVGVLNSWPAPTVPPLGKDDVHLWVAALQKTAATLLEWRAVLSDEERERADRFHREEDRQRYVASHAILRFLLAAYTGGPPDALCPGREEFGKPYLPLDCNPTNVTFNLSHSGGMALYGLARGRRIGVDIEHIRPGIAIQGIASHSFAPGEIAALNSLPQEQRPEAFLAFWTRREACLKATGRGLSDALALIEASTLLSGTAAIVHTNGRSEAGVTLHLTHWKALPDYVCAAAVEGEIPHWHLQSWPLGGF